MIFSSCCLPILLTVKLVVAARRPPRTCSWDWALLLATELGSSVDNVSSYCVVVLKMRCNSYICKSVDTKWCFDARCDMASFYVTQLEQRTGPGGRTGAALAAQLLQGVDSYVEVDVFAATALIHQLLLIKGLKQRKRWKSPTRLSAGRVSYRLEGNVLRWTEFDTFIDKSVEVALADVGGNFGSKLGGYDGALHWTTLQRSTIARLTFENKRIMVRNVNLEACRYLHGGRVCHSLLHDSGWGLGYDASSGLGLDRHKALAGGWPPTGTWFHNEGTHATLNLKLMGSWY